MKGDYAGAAKRLAQDNSNAILASVDATVEQSLGTLYNIKGYPTLKYFYKGKFYEEFTGGRRKMDFVEYIKKKNVAGQKDELWSKDTNRKIRKNEFIYICGSKNGSSNSTVNTGEVWGDVSHAH